MKPLVAGNWKMNTDGASAPSLAAAIAAGLDAEGVDVALCPPFPFLSDVKKSLAGAAIALGAQNCHEQASGAYTGAVSAGMLKSIGVDLVILGHSERRHVFGEDDARILAKTRAVLDAGLSVILCVGEQLDERDAGRHEEVVTAQIKAVLPEVKAEELPRLSIAYEPVWAIGTGRTASPEQAGAMHAVVRRVVGELHGEAAAAAMRILYGGSVKPGNAGELLATAGVNGALVGGASLKAEDFLAIIAAGAASQAE